MKTHYTRRSFLKDSAIFGAGIASMAALPSTLFASERFTLYGAPALISLTLAVASKEGRAKEILSYNFDTWKTPDQLREGFAGKDFVLSASPSNVGVNLANQGLPVKMLNILTNGLNYIFTRDSNVKELGDLEGKNLIVPFKNDLPDIVLQALCKALGVNLDKINITFVQTPPEAVMLFVSKDEYDAVLTQEPMATSLSMMAMKSGVTAHRSIDMQKLWEATFKQCPKIPQAGLIVDVEFYKNNGAFFEAFHSDLKDALAWIQGNPQSAAKLGSKYLPTPEMAIQRAIPFANFVVDKCSDRAEQLNSFFEIVYELNPKFLGGKMPDKSLYL